MGSSLWSRLSTPASGWGCKNSFTARCPAPEHNGRSGRGAASKMRTRPPPRAGQRWRAERASEERASEQRPGCSAASACV